MYFDNQQQKVIHTVGPQWSGGNRNEETLLESAVRHSLKAAVDNKCKSISLPAISSGIWHAFKNIICNIVLNVSVIGIFGYPKEQCASVIIKTVLQFVKDGVYV